MNVMCFLSSVLLVLYISDVCHCLSSTGECSTMIYNRGVWDLLSCIHTGNMRAFRVISDSPALRCCLFIPHPSAHHPKSAACSFKVKWINSPPLLLGVCFQTFIPEESSFCFMAAFVPNANEGQQWVGRASGDCVVLVRFGLLNNVLSFRGTHGLTWHNIQGNLLMHHRLFRHLKPW